MNKKTKRLIAVLGYVFFIFLPIIVMFAFPMPERRELWRDISVALGFLGLSMAGLQFLPTARIKFFADALDLDKVYKSHHILSILSVLFIFLHPVILLFNNPYTLLLLNPFTAPWRAQAGIFGLAGLMLIGITSVLRQEVKLGYNKWHGLHYVLTLGIAVFALIHVFKVNYYSASPAMAAAWIAEAIIWGAATLYMRVIKPIQIKRTPYRIDMIEKETPDTWSICVEPDGHEGFDFNAGQVAWINFDGSPFTLHRNPFSISNSAHCKTLRFSIKVVGDFTSKIPEAKPGDLVYVDGPYGSLSIDDPRMRDGMVLIAGGIGSAPIMSILHTLADSKDKRPIHFFYGCYDKENIIFKKELDDLEKRLNLNITYVLEQEPEDFDCDVGFITRDIFNRDLPENRKELFYFICGPLVMIDIMKEHLSSLNIPNNQIEVEEYEMA